MKTTLTILAIFFALNLNATNRIVRTKTRNNTEVSNGAKLESIEYFPITKRTYELETKRKGSTSGYKKEGNKYYKSTKIVK